MGEALRLYCLCPRDGGTKAGRRQRSRIRSWISHPGRLQSATSLSGFGVSSQSPTSSALSTILFQVTPILIIAIPSEHLRHTSSGKDFFFVFPSVENKELLYFICSEEVPVVREPCSKGYPWGLTFPLCPQRLSPLVTLALSVSGKAQLLSGTWSSCLLYV